MNKFLVAFLTLAMAAVIASGGVGITWTTIYGAYSHSALDTTSGNDLFAGTPIGPVGNLSMLARTMCQFCGRGEWRRRSWHSWDYVGGDDVVWGQRVIPVGGNGAGSDSGAARSLPLGNNWMVQASGLTAYEDLSWNTAGFVYQRVFETTAPNLGDWYFQTPLLALNIGYAGGGQPTQDFALDTSDAGFQPNQQVPEPATMGLLGLGALVMAIRRRRS
jgi:hypothetical protein